MKKNDNEDILSKTKSIQLSHYSLEVSSYKARSSSAWKTFTVFCVLLITVFVVLEVLYYGSREFSIMCTFQLCTPFLFGHFTF